VDVKVPDIEDASTVVGVVNPPAHVNAAEPLIFTVVGAIVPEVKTFVADPLETTFIVSIPVLIVVVPAVTLLSVSVIASAVPVKSAALVVNVAPAALFVSINAVFASTPVTLKRADEPLLVMLVTPGAAERFTVATATPLSIKFSTPDICGDTVAFIIATTVSSPAPMLIASID
jgi:hypothetical protein